MVDSSSKAFYQHIKRVFDQQATTTGQEVLNHPLDHLATSQAIIAKTVTSLFTCKGDNGKAKCLLKNMKSLLCCLNIVKQDKSKTLYVYIPTTQLHLVDPSSFPFPVNL